MSKVAFLGMGVMGYPMAGHLSKINEVTVYNRTLSKSQKWIKEHNGKFISKLSENGFIYNSLSTYAPQMCILILLYGVLDNFIKSNN